jgi:hypothetical protein
MGFLEVKRKRQLADGENRLDCAGVFASFAPFASIASSLRLISSIASFSLVSSFVAPSRILA